MGLLDDLGMPERIRPCRVRTVLETHLDDKDAEILRKAIASPDWPARTLSVALKQRGVFLSDTAIATHRKGMCSCGKID